MLAQSRAKANTLQKVQQGKQDIAVQICVYMAMAAAIQKSAARVWATSYRNAASRATRC